MKDKRNVRAKRIGRVSLVVDVAIMSVAISRTSMRVFSSSMKARSLRSLTEKIAVALGEQKSVQHLLPDFTLVFAKVHPNQQEVRAHRQP